MAKTGWKNPPNTEALKKFFGKSSVEVGILENAPDYPDGTSIHAVANWQEFGTATFPGQHWLKKAGNKDRKYHEMQISKILKKQKGVARDSLFRAFGRNAAEKIANHIERNDINLRANKSSTQSKKGGNSPLIDTQHLIRAIDSRVSK